MSDNPLGLPQGSIRALITLIMVAISTIAAFTGNEKVIQTFSHIVAVIIGYYFGNRTTKG